MDTWVNLVPGLAAVLVAALALRLLTLPLLMAAQQAARTRAQAAVGERLAPGGFPAAVVGEWVLGVIASTGLLLLLRTDGLLGFELLTDSIVFGDARELVIMAALPWAAARVWFVAAAVALLVVALVLWAMTRRSLRTASGPGDTSDRRFQQVGPVLLAAVVGVFLPVGVVLGALVFQAVAFAAAHRSRPTVRAAAAPMQAYPGYPPAVPPVPSASPSPYVPTQADAGRSAAHTPGHAGAGRRPSVPMPAVRELLPGEPVSIGGYRLLGRIGSGGMGTVYLAQREGAATQVALKTLNPELLHDAELLQRFEREGRVLAMVPGAYTARVLDTGVDGGRPYLAMELLDGQPLDAHLRERGPICEPQALRALALALAVALSEVHRIGLVHRDLKPGNIMLTTAGPRLLDFGIAAMVDGTRLTRTGAGIGTLAYMAPEQLDDSAVGPAADVWAWACCIVCAAHGNSPFAGGSTGAAIRRILDTGPEPAALASLRALDPVLAAVVERALTTDPARRPVDGQALVDLLALREEEPAAQPVSVHEQITRGWHTLTL